MIRLLLTSNCVVALVLQLVAFRHPVEAADEVPDASRMRQRLSEVWLRREKSVHSVHFEWHEAMHRVSRATDGEGLPAPAGGSRGKRLRKSLHVSGDWVKYRFDEVDDGNTLRKAVSAFDGEDNVSLHDATSARPYAVAFFHKEPHAFSLSIMHLKPILMTYRGANSKMQGWDIDRLTPTGVLAEIGGHQAELLRVSSDGRSIHVGLWIDMASDGVIRRVEYKSREIPIRTIDINYSQDTSWGFVPKSWTITQYGENGGLVFESQATVTQYHINPPLSRSDFQVPLPPGTWVTDTRTTPVRSHIVLPTGGVRHITAEDRRRRLTYADLVSRGDRIIYTSRLYILGAGLGVLLLVCAVWALRRR